MAEVSRQSSGHAPDPRVLARFGALVVATSLLCELSAWYGFGAAYVLGPIGEALEGAGGLIDVLSLGLRRGLERAVEALGTQGLSLVVFGSLFGAFLVLAGTGRLRGLERRFFWGAR